MSDFATVTGSLTHVSGGAESGFTGTSTVGPQQFSLDLGGAFTVDAIAIWNNAGAGSLLDLELFTDTDQDFTNGTGALFASGVLASSGSAQIFNFSAVSTRYIHINALDCTTCTNNTNPQFFALSEVAFEQAQVPGPATLALMGLGLAGIGYRRQRGKPAV